MNNLNSSSLSSSLTTLIMYLFPSKQIPDMRLGFSNITRLSIQVIKQYERSQKRDSGIAKDQRKIKRSISNNQVYLDMIVIILLSLKRIISIQFVGVKQLKLIVYNSEWIHYESQLQKTFRTRKLNTNEERLLTYMHQFFQAYFSTFPISLSHMMLVFCCSSKPSKYFTPFTQISLASISATFSQPNFLKIICVLKFEAQLAENQYPFSLANSSHIAAILRIKPLPECPCFITQSQCYKIAFLPYLNKVNAQGSMTLSNSFLTYLKAAINSFSFMRSYLENAKSLTIIAPTISLLSLSTQATHIPLPNSYSVQCALTIFQYSSWWCFFSGNFENMAALKGDFMEK